MPKPSYFALFAALVLPAFATDDKRLLHLAVCLTPEEVESSITIKAEYGNGTVATVEEGDTYPFKSDKANPDAKPHRGCAAEDNQFNFGSLEVSAARGSEASFTLHTLVGDKEILKQTCTLTVDDWPSTTRSYFGGRNVSRVFQEIKNDEYDLKCLGLAAPNSVLKVHTIDSATTGAAPTTSRN